MGDLMTCKINADTSNGLKFVSDTSGEIDLQIDASTKVHMASDGKVGIGTSSPSKPLQVKQTAAGSGLSQTDIRATRDEYGADFSGYIDQGVGHGAIISSVDNGTATERMRIDNNGVLMIGTTAAYSDGSIGRGALQVDGRSGSRTGLTLRAKSTDGSSFVTSNVSLLGVVNGNGFIGGISANGTTTTFATSSDYRLKENVSYTFDATSRLKQLKPARFNFIADADTTVDGFLAHEVSSIVPEAITGTKDATRDIGTIKDAEGKVLNENVIEAEKKDGQTWEKTATENVNQGIDQSKLVPLLVKTIQELEARITALES